MEAKKGFFGRIWNKWNSINLIIRIVTGFVIGAVLALIVPGATAVAVLGDIFVGALKGIAPVLVFLLVASSLANANKGIGKRFTTVIVLYLVSTFLAAAIAVVASYLFPVTIVLEEAAESAAPGGIGEVLRNLVTNMVSNPVTAIGNANYLGILFWAVLCGFGLKKFASSNTLNVVKDFAETVSTIVRWIIQLAPFGILGLVFDAVSNNGLKIFTTYGKLLAVLVGCMLFVALIVDPLISGIALKQNPYPIVFKCLRESGVTAFFTRSSAANIPVNMDLCNRMGLDPDFYSVSIPLGATINMDGAAVTITVMTLALCTTLGVQVSIPTAILLSILASVAACGASGVAGGSLLLIPMACSLFGIDNDIAMQAVSVGFIIGVIQDSVETALNSSGDAMFTITADLRDRMKKGEKINVKLLCKNSKAKK
ncbi:MAG: serine/threonine transporter SstT [Lachnospiraceae bacterium]